MGDLLTIGKSGLFASRKSIETTGHNMANANTEGYSRQTTVQQSRIPIMRGGLIEGSGVRVTQIKRMSDELIAKRLDNCQLRKLLQMLLEESVKSNLLVQFLLTPISLAALKH